MTWQRSRCSSSAPAQDNWLGAPPYRINAPRGWVWLSPRSMSNQLIIAVWNRALDLVQWVGLFTLAGAAKLKS